MKFTDPRHTIINKSGFTKFIPQIADNISPYAAMLLAELLNSDSYWFKNKSKYRNKYGHEYTGTFFHKRPEITKRTGLSATFQRKAQKELEEAGILSVEIRGLPRRNYFTINYDELDEFLLTYINSTASEQENEQQEVDEDNYQSSILSTPSRQRDERLEVNQDDDINKNKETILKNKNKVNKATYVAEATDSIDAYYQELGLGSIYTQDSCIKKNTEGSPPGANAQGGTDFDEAIEIIQEYNHAMDIHFKPGEKEISNVLEKINELRKVRKYFNSNTLNKIWNDYSDSYAKSFENRRISGFIKCSLIRQLSKYGPLIVKADDEEIDGLLDKIFRKYGDQITSQISAMGFINSFGSLEPIDASTHFPPSEQRKLRLQLYHQHIKSLLPEDEKHDMIKLEV